MRAVTVVLRNGASVRLPTAGTPRGPVMLSVVSPFCFCLCALGCGVGLSLHVCVRGVGWKEAGKGGRGVLFSVFVLFW
jgi:hypothetical protein